MIENSNVFRYEAERMGSMNQIKQVETDSSFPVYLAFSPKHPKAKEYAALFSAGIQKMAKSGTLKKLLDRYQVQSWKRAS